MTPRIGFTSCRLPSHATPEQVENRVGLNGRPMNRARRIIAFVLLSSIAPTVQVHNSSAVGQYDCLDGRVCVWKNANFGGSRLDTNTDLNSLVPYGYDDQVSSAYNRSAAGTSVKLWEHIDCVGSLITSIAHGAAKAQVANNDKASSLDVIG